MRSPRSRRSSTGTATAGSTSSSRSGRVQVRVVPKDRVFIHGKAGVIEQADGTKTAFLGSINETKSAFAANYEILWEDTSDEGVAWVEEEFQALWADSYPLPDAIIEEVERIAARTEVRLEDLSGRRSPRGGPGREPDLPRRRAAPALAAVLRHDLPPASRDVRARPPAPGGRGRRRQDAVAGRSGDGCRAAR